MKPRLIGLTGAAGSGKDTAAQALTALGWRRDAFADRMRTAILALDPFVPLGGGGWNRLSSIVASLGWDRAKRAYPEVRRLLQKFGTEAGRDIHGDDCWVDALLNDWDAVTPLVITDVRFENEAEAVRNNGGLVVHIRRPGLEALPGDHASEAGIEIRGGDYLVINDSTVDFLHAAVRRAAGITDEPEPLPRLYLSGPMSGIEDHNFPAFDDAAKLLRAAGYEVENPADKGLIEGWAWEDYIRYDLKALVELDALAMLPGWTGSRGAQLEVHVAKALGMPVFPYEHWLKLAGDR